MMKIKYIHTLSNIPLWLNLLLGRMGGVMDPFHPAISELSKTAWARPSTYTETIAQDGTLTLPENLAVVGSSGALAKTNYGELIDSFDGVVRFNRAPVENYETFVGTKTFLRVVNNHVFNNNDLNEVEEGQWGSQPEEFLRELQDTPILYFARDVIPWLKYRKNTNSSCELFRFEYNELDSLKKDVGFGGTDDLSVGAGFIALCISAGIVPHLFGFDTENNSSRDHYWESRPAAGPCHNVSEEKLWLLETEKKGLVKFYR